MGEKIKRTCPMCGKEHALTLTEEEKARYEMYRMGFGNIQDMLPGLGAVEREFIITGYCHKCQSRIFGTRNKPDLSRWS